MVLSVFTFVGCISQGTKTKIRSTAAGPVFWHPCRSLSDVVFYTFCSYSFTIDFKYYVKIDQAFSFDCTSFYFLLANQCLPAHLFF